MTGRNFGGRGGDEVGRTDAATEHTWNCRVVPTRLELGEHSLEEEE